jgi:hypothetical protein
MSAVDYTSQTLREIAQAHRLIPTSKATETEADRLMARNVALQEDDNEA